VIADGVPTLKNVRMSSPENSSQIDLNGAES
jgi:hypothetical protein